MTASNAFFFILLLYSTGAAPTPAPSSSSICAGPIQAPCTPALDPDQVRALQFLHIATTPNPCTHHATVCDTAGAGAFSHLLRLRLTNCSAVLRLSTAALSALTTLTSLTFLNCHTSVVHFPTTLSTNLKSFTSVNSLQRLTGVFLSRLHNLTALHISGDPIKASGVHIITSNIKSLKTITLSNTNLNGYLPKQWNPNLTHVDFSINNLKGAIPISLTQLKNLKLLNFSSNKLNGEIPDSFGELVSLQNLSLSSNFLSGSIPGSISAIPGLVHLDLGSNRFTGTIPEFIVEMKELKFLNLEKNNFHGVLPFNSSFIERLDVFQIDGNADLCYNISTVSEKVKLGIPPCDKHGIPILAPPAADEPPLLTDDMGGGGGGYRGGGGDVEKKREVHVDNRGPSKVVLGVAIGLSALVFLVIFLVLMSKC